MNLIWKYQEYRYASIFLSKYYISQSKYTSIKSCKFLFFINTKEYKKNYILFFVTVSLFMTGIFFIKKQQLSNVFFLKYSILKSKLNLFLYQFVYYYLPQTLVHSHISQIIYVTNKLQKKYTVRFTYYSFPIFLEIESLLSEYICLYDIIQSYKFQLDIILVHTNHKAYMGEFILRFYRVPCKLYSGV